MDSAASGDPREGLWTLRSVILLFKCSITRRFPEHYTNELIIINLLKIKAKAQFCILFRSVLVTIVKR